MAAFRHIDQGTPNRAERAQGGLIVARDPDAPEAEGAHPSESALQVLPRSTARADHGWVIRRIGHGADVLPGQCLDRGMNLAQRERHAWCDAAARVGPDAPTLCEGWQVRDLAAHLAVRDSRPDATVAMMIPALRQHAHAVQAEFAAGDFDDLVDRVRTGPPRWSPTRLSAVDHTVNLVEFVVHHADVVRADPSWTAPPAPPHPGADPATASAVWSFLRRGGRLLYRDSPVGVVLRVPGSGRAVVRRPPRGRGTVVLTGQGVELLLHAFGRVDHCHVEVAGEPSDVDAFAATALGV